jgi:hypothetical protein
MEAVTSDDYLSIKDHKCILFVVRNQFAFLAVSNTQAAIQSGKL